MRVCNVHIPLVPRTASPLPDRMEDCGRNPEKGERKGDLIWTRTVLPKLSSLGGGGALFSS